MGAAQELKAIAHFEAAYQDRWNDFSILRSESRRSFSMHVGAVVIECLLKSFIVRRHGIVKVKGIHFWYNENAENQLLAIQNPTKPEYESNQTVRNPGHDFQAALRCLPELNAVLTSDMSHCFETVHNPFHWEKGDFTGIRYLSEQDVSEAEYREWLHSFIKCYNWLGSNRHLIP